MQARISRGDRVRFGVAVVKDLEEINEIILLLDTVGSDTFLFCPACKAGLHDTRAKTIDFLPRYNIE
jgi:hypothetical protein